jgi:hypothetical protein
MKNIFYSFIITITGCAYSTSLLAQEVSYLSNGNLIHNGKAVFPIGYWMEYNPIADKEKAADTLIKYGFDIISYGVPVTDKTRFENIFNKAKTNNIRILLGLYGSGEATTTDLAQDWILNSVDGANIRANTALLGYYHSDDVYRFSPADLIAKNNFVKSKDDTRITTISSFFSGATSANYMPAADMVAAQVYPVTSAFFHNAYTNSRNLVIAAKEANKAPAIYPQTHNVGLWTGSATERMPTPRELDVTTYLNLIAGAKSLWFYTYGATDKTPTTGLINYQNDVWLKSLQIKNELRNWERVFLYGKHFTETDITAGSANYTIYQGHWIYGNKVYVIAANSWQNDIRGNRSTNVSITLPEGTTGPIANVYSNRNQTLSIANNILSGNIDYYDVQMYELPYTKPTVINGGFQEDFSDWSNNGGLIINEGAQKYLKANNTVESNTITKDITHRILPNKTYTLRADTKSSGAGTGGIVFIQFRDYKNNNIVTHQINASASSTFTPGFINFTTPGEFGYVTVGVWRNNPGAGDFFVDNITIAENTNTVLNSESIVLEAMKENNYTVLKWRGGNNSSGDDYQTFTLQRSNDNNPFEDIAVMNRNSTANYNSTDYSNKQGKLKYRIKAATLSGKIVYSNTVVIDNSSNSPILIYPNPANNIITITFTNQSNVIFKLFDEKGSLVKSRLLQNMSNAVYTEDLPAGMYFYEIRNNTKELIQKGKLLVKH